jgi:hypothetical protein
MDESKPVAKKKNGNGHLKIEIPTPAEYVATELENKRLKALIRHKTNVQQSCLFLGEQLIAAGDKSFGRRLITNGFIHDHSKFEGIEWLYLHEDVKIDNTAMFKMALLQHTHNTPHHPEYWDGIKNMPSIYLAEFVCDIHARGSEFGTDVREWIKMDAAEKFDFTLHSKVYKDVKQFLDILLMVPFK